ncbi:DsbE family thiol:disulfide interchange protein [Sinorhizobium meliloti]|uniref:DsbE family thiol:disulfide interchange protein n=1 Tax=Rhizobium meliloti TaxID=382 RepID=UPI001296FF93|nr:DsbE family thiol:disulfide interchange protein [Sinorhizobium meliloti]MDW9377858.1 DsbE family thiol:disulfide interchange protein [Sinorhizobium meliloti]MDW9496304.1 DsbE family thiol:disulfide interchange protein [Sinorhizobium meliloti]MDW9565067.1 DsbE family thiol:disulfide interchange protein [Sinorhizobium meliloti]MDW9652192.1 DsbE family thiol:disulfide interchange protein [Sinorhizobium meliloti]MDW9862354.1 DsbE family thiol:disulfide interchange protein [Sinorhizobium melilot
MSSKSQTTRILATTPSSLWEKGVGTTDTPSLWLRRTVMLLPVGIFAGLAVMLGWGLNRNAQVIPSALIGKQVPVFRLSPVQGRTIGLSSTDLTGEVSLVNVFASWCTACREEHPVFMELKRTHAVPIHGINYKDRPQDAEKWLDTMGDPYTRTGADLNGRVSIDWGVYGVPETFVIDRRGRIAFKHVGAVTPEVYRDSLAPLIAELRK